MVRVWPAGVGWQRSGAPVLISGVSRSRPTPIWSMVVQTVDATAPVIAGFLARPQWWPLVTLRVTAVASVARSRSRARQRW